VPAAAVIPAPIAHTNIAAVKTLVVERRHRSGFWDVSSRVFGEHAVVGPRDRLRVIFGDQYPRRLRLGARGAQWRTPSGCVTNLGGEDGSLAGSLSDVPSGTEAGLSLGDALGCHASVRRDSVTVSEGVVVEDPRRETGEQRQPSGPELSPAMAPS